MCFFCVKELFFFFFISYEIIDTANKEIIYSTTEHYERSSSEYKDPRDLPSASSLAKNSITSYSSKLMKKIHLTQFIERFL